MTSGQNPEHRAETGGQHPPERIRFRDAEPAKRRRHWFVIVVLSAVVLLVGAVVGDIAFRGYAADLVKNQVQKSLPAGVSGNVTVRIGGPSAIVQYLTGRFDEIELTAPAITAGGVPVRASVTAFGVPVDQTQPIQRATGSVSIDQAGVGSLLTVAGVPAGATLGDGVVTLAGNVTLLGSPVPYSAAVAPTVTGSSITLTPKAVTVNGVSVGPLVDSLLASIGGGGNGLTLCLAQYLPAALTVDAVAVTPSAATATVSARSIVLSPQTLAQRGSCN